MATNEHLRSAPGLLKDLDMDNWFNAIASAFSLPRETAEELDETGFIVIKEQQLEFSVHNLTPRMMQLSRALTLKISGSVQQLRASVTSSIAVLPLIGFTLMDQFWAPLPASFGGRLS